MTDRCEPPEHLRGVDGWHWVQLPFVTVPTPIAWMRNPDNHEHEWKMPSSPAFVSGESKTAQTWRYHSPVATPEEVEALRAERDGAFSANLEWKVKCENILSVHNALRARVETLEAALKWMIDNDETNSGNTPIPELKGQTWDEYNAYWLDGLNKARAALENNQ